MNGRRRSAGWTLLSAAAAAGGALTALALPSLTGSAVGHLADGGPAGPAIAFLTLFLLADVSLGVIESLSNAAYVTGRTADLRRRAGVHALERLRRRPGADEPAAAEPAAADVTTRLLEDAAQASDAVPVLVSVALSSVSGVVALVALARIDWRLLVALVLTVLLLILVLRRFVLNTSKLLAEYRAGQAELAGRLLDAQAGAASIRAHGTWRRERERVLAPLARVRAAGEAVWTAQSGLAWRTGVSVPAAELVTIVVAGIGLSQGRLDVGQFVAAIGYTGLVLAALDGLETAAGWNYVQVGRRRVAELSEAGTAPTGWRTSAPGTAATLTLDGVTVRDGDDILLDDIELDLPDGSFTVVVSDSAAARGALADVLAGSRPPERGRVRLAGTSLAEIAPDRREHLISRVFPRPALLGRTVGDLIGLRGSPSHGAVREAAERARIAAVIDALPEGFDTPLADLDLSGGEAQRLGIAQVLAGGAPVLVFDDATSSLDAATEREVLTALLAAGRGRTCVLVTNRPVAAARVFRLDHGRLTRVPGPSRAETTDAETTDAETTDAETTDLIGAVA